MSELVRFGVSLDASLLEEFDALCSKRNYASRSEALRDIIRAELLDDRVEQPGYSEHMATGVLNLVYDHHQHDLSQQLTQKQHDAHGAVVASLHVHLDHHNCLEILVLKGTAAVITRLAESLRAVRGVKLGTFSIAEIGQETTEETE